MSRAALLLMPLTLAAAGLHAQQGAPGSSSQSQGVDLASLSLEELMSLQITSVSRRTEALSRAPASIFVITSEDIRRSGATSLPEALRLAPNLQVARRNSYEYAITARGFNNSIGNKLLVLIDGRTVYTPLFSGVFWEMQDTLMEDIERIEVISGPGATLWGANAVNGVINVITRRATDTTGLHIQSHAGNFERGAGFRSGHALGERGGFRVYGKTQEWDNTKAQGRALPDAFDRQQIGFRADWGTEDQAFTFQGDALRGESVHRGFVGSSEIRPVRVEGMNLLGRWTRQLAGDSRLVVQAYWNRAERDEMVLFSPDSDIFNLEFQHSFSSGVHQIVWGGGYTHADDNIHNGAFTIYVPNQRQLNWESLYVQDEIELSPALSLTPGVKLEWNDYTGMEYMPSLRFAWQAADAHTLWAALSRAIRAPSRFDRDVYFPEQPPFIVAGGPDFVSEVAHVTELGYRGRIGSDFTLTATLYHHDWDKLRSGTPLPLPVFLANNIRGESYGLEAWAQWQPAQRLRLQAGFTSIEKNLFFRHGSSDTVGVNNSTLHNDPDRQWLLRASATLVRNVEMDLQLRHVEELEVEPVPAYTELDLWLAWRASDSLELFLSGRNLLHGSHPEYNPAAQRHEIPRNFLVGFEWKL